jgi:hypothetical protein
LILAAFGVAALARRLLTPESFGQYGSYRGAAVEEARNIEPKHQGEKVCGECHAENAKVRPRDAHGRVQCEDCHGVGLEHVKWHRPRIKLSAEQRAKSPEKAKLRKPQGNDWCMVCHERLAARPGDHPQVDPQAHFKLVGAATADVSCRACHDPHRPLNLLADLRSATVHPMLYRCRDCHTGRLRDETTLDGKKSPHSSIFSCTSCHKQRTESHGKGKHSKLECTKCHIFFRDTALAGRILRDGGPGFCLLCHKAGKFRKEGSRPTITWPEHRSEMGSGDADAKKICSDCHRQALHPAPESEKKDDSGDGAGAVSPARGDKAAKTQGAETGRAKASTTKQGAVTKGGTDED